MATATKRRPAKKKADPVRAGAKAHQAGKRLRRVVTTAPVNGESRDPLAVNTNEVPKGVGRRKAGSKFAKDQPTLPGEDMAKVDERIAALDLECEKLLAHEEKKKEIAKLIRETYGEIGKLIKENSIDCYILKSEKFYIKPAGEEVTHERIKQKG